MGRSSPFAFCLLVSTVCHELMAVHSCPGGQAGWRASADACHTHRGASLRGRLHHLLQRYVMRAQDAMARASGEEGEGRVRFIKYGSTPYCLPGAFSGVSLRFALPIEPLMSSRSL